MLRHISNCIVYYAVILTLVKKAQRLDEFRWFPLQVERTHDGDPICRLNTVILMVRTTNEMNSFMVKSTDEKRYFCNYLFRRDTVVTLKLHIFQTNLFDYQFSGVIQGITVFKIFSWGAISLDIHTVTCRLKTKLSTIFLKL